MTAETFPQFPWLLTFMHSGVSFSATYAAERWLREHGFSCGAMAGDSPRGLQRGNWMIAKWRNLSGQEKNSLDGVLISDDPRDGDVTICLRVDPSKRLVLI